MVDTASIWSDAENRRHVVASQRGRLHRLRAVCKSWRSATVDPPPQLPWVMLLSCDESTIGGSARTFHRLSDGNKHTLHLPPEAHGRRIVGSDNGWLVLTDYNSSVVRLLDPIRRAQILLPPLKTLAELQGQVEVADAETLKKFCLLKAIVIQSKHSTQACDHQIGMVIAIVVGVELCYNIVFIRPGDSCWTMIMSEGERYRWSDISLHGDQVHAVGKQFMGECGVFRCDIGPPSKVTPIARFVGHNWSSYLVESSGDLLVVDRKPCSLGMSIASETIGFDVYRLDQSDAEAKLVEVASLGDRILFLGLSRSLSLPVTDFRRWKGNCIYFTPVSYPDLVATPDCGVFDLDVGYTKSLPCYPDDSSQRLSPMLFFVPRLSREKGWGVRSAF